MIVTDVKTKDIKPYKNNARKNDTTVKGVAASIKEFGFWQPLVLDKNNVIVCGHVRLKAAQELGMETVPCVYADDLTPKQIQVFRLADNKTADMSMWDSEPLKVELAKIPNIDMGQFGFESMVADIDMRPTQKEYAVIVNCDNEKDRDEKLSFFIEQGYDCEVF